MLFMVRIKVELPGEMDPARVQELGEAETARGIELVQAGRLRKVWRIVGERANFSIWDAETHLCVQRVRVLRPLSRSKPGQKKTANSPRFLRPCAMTQEPSPARQSPAACSWA